MVKPDFVARLVELLRDRYWGARQSSVEVIIALVEFGRLIYHFVLCED